MSEFDDARKRLGLSTETTSSQQDEGPDSWQGLGGVLKGLVNIPGGLASDALATVRGVVQAPVTGALLAKEALTGQPTNLGELEDSAGGMLVNTDVIRAARNPDQWQGFQQAAESVNPAITHQAQSMGRTAQGIGVRYSPLGMLATAATQGRALGPDPYVTAYQKGELAPKAFEDIANIGMLASAGAGGIGALAGRASAAEGAQLAERGLTLAPPVEAAAPEAAGAQAAAAATSPERLAQLAAETEPITAQGLRTITQAEVPSDLSWFARQAPKLRGLAEDTGTAAEAANKVAGAPFRLPLQAVGKVDELLAGGAGKRLLADRAQQILTRGEAGMKPGIQTGMFDRAEVAPAVAEAAKLVAPGAEEEAALNILGGVVNEKNFPAVQSVVENAPPLPEQAINAKVGMGSVVGAADRGNYGTITALGDDTATVHFESPKGGVEDVELPYDQLTPRKPIEYPSGEGMSPAERQQMAGKWSKLQEIAPGLTPEALDTLAEHYRGTNPTLSIRLMAAASTLAKPLATMAENYKSGKGERNIPNQQLREEAVGHEPMMGAVQRDIERSDEPIKPGGSTPVELGRLTPEQAETGQALMKEEQTLAKKVADEPNDPELAAELTDVQQQLETHMKEIAQHPDYAPADYRSVLKTNIGLRDQIHSDIERLRGTGNAGDAATADAMESYANDLATTMEGLREQGVTQHGHLVFGREDLPFPAGGPGGTKPPTFRKVGSTYQREGTGVKLSFQEQAHAMLRRYQQQAQNEALMQLVDEHGMSLDQLGQKFGTTNLKELEAEGYVPADLGKPGYQVDPRQVKEDTTFLPKPVVRGLKDIITTTGSTDAQRALVGAYDKGLSALKTAWLPLSPRWLVNNVVGNAMMAVAGGVSPADWFVNFRETMKRIKNPDENAATVMRSGFTHEFRDYNPLEVAVDEGRIKSALKKTIELGYKGNQWVDDFFHVNTMVTLEKRGAQLRNWAEAQRKAGLLSDARYEELMNSKAAFTPETAVKESLRVMGDFSNLSFTERNVVRRVMPFYPWYKHITKLAMSLPIENPYRAAWLAKLSDEYKDDTNRPDWLEGAIKTPAGWLRGGLNPFPGGGTESPLLNPAKTLGATSPAITWPLAAFGFNAGAGRMINQAPGARDQDKLGFIGAPQFAGYLARQIPQLKALQDFEDPRVKYDTGELMRTGAAMTPVQSTTVGGRWAAPVSLLTGLTLDNPKLGQLNAQEAKKQYSQRMSAQKYARAADRRR